MKKIVPIILMVVGIILLLSMFRYFTTTLTESGNDAQYGTDNCSGYAVDAAGLALQRVESVSTTNCSNSSGVATLFLAGNSTLPLSSLMGAAGILMLLLVAGIFIVGYKWVTKR